MWLISMRLDLVAFSWSSGVPNIFRAHSSGVEDEDLEVVGKFFVLVQTLAEVGLNSGNHTDTESVRS